MNVDEVDAQRRQRAVDRYVTYQETIEQAGARHNISREAAFEIHQEAHVPPLESLFLMITDMNPEKQSDEASRVAAPRMEQE